MISELDFRLLARVQNGPVRAKCADCGPYSADCGLNVRTVFKKHFMKTFNFNDKFHYKLNLIEKFKFH